MAKLEANHSLGQIFPKRNFRFGTKLFWCFIRDWINWLNENEAILGTQNITPKRSVMSVVSWILTVAVLREAAILMIAELVVTY